MNKAIYYGLVFILSAMLMLCFIGFADDLNINKIREFTPNYREAIAEKYKLNTDTVGWIHVPGTNINDVVVQNPPYNNSFYLNHDFAGNPNKDGIFCADRRSKLTRGGEICRNITVYGHSWEENRDGILFEQLKRYINPDFAKDHPYIFFSTSDTNMAWEVFAVFYTTVELPYIVPDLSWERFNSVLQVAYASSLYNYGITITESDKILTLSTCTYFAPGIGNLPVGTPNNYRYVVMARLVDPDSVKIEKAFFSLNNNILPVNRQPKIERDDPEYNAKQFADSQKQSGMTEKDPD